MYNWLTKIKSIIYKHLFISKLSPPWNVLLPLTYRSGRKVEFPCGPRPASRCRGRRWPPEPGPIPCRTQPSGWPESTVSRSARPPDRSAAATRRRSPVWRVRRPLLGRRTCGRSAWRSTARSRVRCKIRQPAPGSSGTPLSAKIFRKIHTNIVNPIGVHKKYKGKRKNLYKLSINVIKILLGWMLVMIICWNQGWDFTALKFTDTRAVIRFKKNR